MPTKTEPKGEIKTMWVVLRLQSFEVEAYPGFPEIKISAGKMIGYLPVYRSQEDALADFPGTEIAPIREVTHAV